MGEIIILRHGTQPDSIHVWLLILIPQKANDFTYISYFVLQFVYWLSVLDFTEFGRWTYYFKCGTVVICASELLDARSMAVTNFRMFHLMHRIRSLGVEADRMPSLILDVLRSPPPYSTVRARTDHITHHLLSTILTMNNTTVATSRVQSPIKRI